MTHFHSCSEDILKLWKFGMMISSALIIMKTFILQRNNSNFYLANKHFNHLTIALLNVLFTRINDSN